MAGEQSLEKMGGFRKAMPFTYGCFIIGGLALSGIPPFSGFFSKDEILLVTGERGGWHWALYVAGYIGAFLTAIYTFRMIFRAFHGEPVPEARELEGGHLHHAEVPRNPANGEEEDYDVGFPGPTHAIAERALPMKVAMGVLALGAIGIGLVQIPKVDFVIDDFLRPSFATSLAVRTAHQNRPAVVRARARHGARPGGHRDRLPHLGGGRRGTQDVRGDPSAYARPVYELLVHKWYFDELIDAARGAPVAAARALRARHVRARVRRRHADRRHHRPRARGLGGRARGPERLRALLRRAADRGRGRRRLLLPAAELMPALSILIWLPLACGLLGALVSVRSERSAAGRGAR